MKILTENRDMPPPINKIFSIPEIFWKTEGFLYKEFRFGPVKQKILAKSWYPPPLYAWKFLLKDFFWNTTVFSNEFFWDSQTKNFRRKNVISAITKKKFRYPKFSETLKGCPGNFSALWDLKFLAENVIPPLFPPQNFSKPETFSKTVGFPYEIFRHCETSKFRLEIVICRLLSISFLRYQKFFGKQKVSFTMIFVSVLWDKKNW